MASYVLWANKGGIGKSTLSFQLACKYARIHRDTPTFVIDLSPQCDVSRMLLGGGRWDGEAKILELMQQPTRKTIYQYLRECVRDVPNGQGWPSVRNFVIKPNDVRDVEATDLPDNLYMICGDFDLERATHDIESLSQPPKRGGLVPTGAYYSRYLLPRTFLRKAVEDIEAEYPGATIFIDTDPYYSVVTTHLGLLAAQNLITAYSPSSQASQYAVYRSLEFLHATGYSLSDDIVREKALYPEPWFDSRDQQLYVPPVNVPTLSHVISNMTTSKAGVGEPRYSQPQQLHRSVINAVTSEINNKLTALNQTHIPEFEHIWALQRLGLICDYNGIDMSSIVAGGRYSQPDSTEMYRVDRSADNQMQMDAYNQRIEAVVNLL
ncbi:AAA family ATPase [Cronobacter sakazakii]|uniref:ParA family protein n=1 Tax=Cronobacter TaxID=413496 RepID=UPI000CFB52B8|nr:MULTISPECIES: AAA family ATPase [Cronobacter]EGT4508490.1 ParA family protein [Cronobacter sakazakii]ELQ6018618.1 AAA family ATPase [Cronobacter sakazakii]ELY4345632.1 AAA family ATPase [Cronobacter sakazakii]ELY4757596.1 AAA family ATPase [Cronobacter sakazakii]ELY6341296.1 AAA family ATPase [Cronobacter sakazakii]